MQTNNPLVQQLKGWVFPFCDLGGEHGENQLNKICLDERCREGGFMLDPHCVICEEVNIHNQMEHKTKPLKMILRDLAGGSLGIENSKIHSKDLEIQTFFEVFIYIYIYLFLFLRTLTYLIIRRIYIFIHVFIYGCF